MEQYRAFDMVQLFCAKQLGTIDVAWHFDVNVVLLSTSQNALAASQISFKENFYVKNNQMLLIIKKTILSLMIFQIWLQNLKPNLQKKYYS